MPKLSLNPRCKLLAVLLPAGLLGACAVGPDYRAPETLAAPRLLREDATPAGLPTVAAAAADGQPAAAALDPRWWTAFGSARLNRLVEQALAHNPGIDSARENLRAALAQVAAQRALYLPDVQAGYSFSRANNGDVISPTLASGDPVYSLHTAQLSVGFVPDLFGGNRRQVESLQATADSQRWQLDALRLTLVGNLANAVLQEESLGAQLAAATQVRALALAQWQQAQGQLKAGQITALDVAQQELAYTQADSALPPLHKQIELLRNQIAILAGVAPAALDVPALGSMPVRAAAADFVDQLPRSIPSSWLQQRPDVKAAEASYHAAFAQIGVAEAARWPQLSIDAGLGFNHNALAGLLSAANRSWSVQAGVAQTVFAGGALAARKTAAEAAAAAARSLWESTVLNALQNTADALYAIDADRQGLRTALQAEAAAERVARLTRIQFDAGQVARPAWLAAQQAWMQARQSRLAAQALCAGDAVALHVALGATVQPALN